MITKKKAIEIVEEYLEKEFPRYNLVLMMEHTVEFEYGWVFFYQTKEYVETKDYLQMLEGNAPIIINKNDGGLHVTGTSSPVEKYIRDYIKSRQ